MAKHLGKKHLEFLKAQGVDGMTKNMLLGKARRLGLGKKPNKIKGKNESPRRNPAIKQKAVRTPVQVTRILNPGSPPIFTPIQDKAAMDELSIKGITFDELTASSCRWPIGDPQDKDFKFCGCKAIKRSYCAIHAAKAFVPLQRAYRSHVEMVSA
jgi:GcrA cell cycle regulator